MNFNNNDEWKSYVTEVIVIALVLIAYTATFGMALEM